MALTQGQFVSAGLAEAGWCFFFACNAAINRRQDVSKDYSLTRFKFVKKDFSVERRLANYQCIEGDKASQTFLAMIFVSPC